MKKTLLTTTAIIAAFVATEAQANSLQVNVGGYADFQAANVSDDIVDNAANVNTTDFNTDSEIHVSVTGKADNGLEYGAVAELEAAVADSTDKYNNGNTADKVYLFLQGGWGRVEMGENTGAEEALSVNTGDFASATGGVDGDFYRYVALDTTASGTATDNGTADTVNAGFAGIVRPILALAEGGVTGATANEDATKVTYYSPRFNGFQLGASYAANSDDVTRTGAPALGTSGNEDVFSGGVNYQNQFDEIGVNASLTGVKGTSKVATVNRSATLSVLTASSGNDLEGYEAGANLSYAGFTVGGSYGDYLDTYGSNSDATYYDAGVGYKTGALSASATYFNSEVDLGTVRSVNGAGSSGGADTDTFNAKSEFENIALGVDYQLAPGLVPYAEVSFFDADASGANDNSGTVALIGTELSF